MFEGITTFFRRVLKPGQALEESSKDTAKERLHLVLMQDRARVSADFLELMKQELIEVIKKYVVVDEEEIDVRLINPTNEDGTTGAPELYATIPIINIRNDIKVEKVKGAESEKKSEKNNDVLEQGKDEKSEEKKENSSTANVNEKGNEKKNQDSIAGNNNNVDTIAQKSTEVEKNDKIEESIVENTEENTEESDQTSNNKEDVNNNSKDEE